MRDPEDPPGPSHYTYKEVYVSPASSTLIKPPVIENIPEQLIERPQWVCWKLEKREAKLTKVPYTPGTGRRASSTDLLTWAAFSEALAAYEAGNPSYHGIGFCFCSADPFVGIDLDGCRNPQTGEVEPRARKIIDTFADEGYVEASPSGAGVHIIVNGVQKEGTRRGRIEVYGQDRFFTITGEKIS
jgi:primase-polymerase (primpol)-like protein